MKAGVGARCTMVNVWIVPRGGTTVHVSAVDRHARHTSTRRELPGIASLAMLHAQLAALPALMHMGDHIH